MLHLISLIILILIELSIIIILQAAIIKTKRFKDIQEIKRSALDEEQKINLDNEVN